MSEPIFSAAASVLNAMLTNVIVLDQQLMIQYTNPAAQQLLGQSDKKLLGTFLPNLFHYFSLNLELMQSALKKGQIFTDNEVNVVINTQYHSLSITAQPLNAEHILLELIPLNTHKRLSHEQLQNAQQHAAKELIRRLAHEIKNPLGGLRGAAQLLAKELKSSPLVEYTQLIIEQADRLRNLVDRLLGPQRLTERKQHNIHQTIERIYALLMLEKQENITLIRDYDPSLPDLIYDPEQLEQAILNIARNALQALSGRAGDITLRTRTAFNVTLHGKNHRVCVRIDIEDNGPGVPSALRDTLFYPMISGRAEGSGLGLSIARNLVDQHLGKIDYHSWPGHTEFSIYLPIRQRGEP